MTNRFSKPMGRANFATLRIAAWPNTFWAVVVMVAAVVNLDSPPTAAQEKSPAPNRVGTPQDNSPQAALSADVAAGGPTGVAAGGPRADAPLAREAPIQTKNLLLIVRDGGPLMYPIGLCSIVLLMFVFERAISLRRGRVIPRPFVKRFLDQLREGQLDRAAAIELCEKNSSPVSEVFLGALKKWGRPAVEVEQAIIDTGERVIHGLRRYLRLLNGVATISPLLGLLGTVVGMIRAFNSIATADAMGRPELLAAGISQALLTTAAGLSVAIPALIAYLFFVGRVDRLIIDMDLLGQKLVGIISAEAIEEAPLQPQAKTKRRSKSAA